MARPLRLEFENALYHVTSRGDRRESIYRDDLDRESWLSLLAAVCARFNWRVYAYCLMSNHYHFLVQTPEGNLSSGMRQLNGVYTQQVNRRHGLSGHVFQGRFKAILVDADSYLLELGRYVVLNPVRAGMVQDAGDWPWSSYRATLAAQPPSPEWLASDALLGHFNSHFRGDQSTAAATRGVHADPKQRAIAQQRYVDHVRAGVGLPSVWEELSGQIYLGSDAFLERVQAHIAEQLTSPERPASAGQEVPRAQRKPAKRALATYAYEHAGDRNSAIKAAFASGHYSMAAIAEHFAVHYTTVSRIVNEVGRYKSTTESSTKPNAAPVRTAKLTVSSLD